MILLEQPLLDNYASLEISYFIFIMSIFTDLISAW